MSDSDLPPAMQYKPVTLTPQQFELEVEKLLNKLGSGKLAEFKTQRLETIQGTTANTRSTLLQDLKH